jgi:hypothetical protein
MAIEKFSDINESNLEEAKALLTISSGLPELAFSTVMYEGKEHIVTSETLLDAGPDIDPVKIPEGTLETLEVVDSSINTRIINFAFAVVEYNVKPESAVLLLQTLLVVEGIVPPAEYTNEYTQLLTSELEKHPSFRYYMLENLSEEDKKDLRH